MGDDDPHEVLGIRRNASQKEVRDAYRRMAKEHHPDVSDAPDAEEKFVRIRNAYEEMYEDAEKREGQRESGSDKRSEEDGSYARSGSAGPQDFSSSENVYEGSSTHGDRAWATSSASSTEADGERDYRWTEKGAETEERKRNKRTRNRHEDDGERVEGLRGGWEILRDVVEGDEVSWFVHSPRGGYYLDDDAERTRSRHGFSSRSRARKAYKKYRKSEKRTSPGPRYSRGHSFRVTERLDDMWRLARGKKGFAVVSHGQPPTFLNDSGNVAIRPQWFPTEKEAREAHDRRNERAKPSMGRRTRILLAPFLIPFFATLAILGALGGSEGTGSKNYRVYLSGGISTAFLMTLAYATGSFLVAGIATVNLVFLCVLILSPYDMPNG